MVIFNSYVSLPEGTSSPDSRCNKNLSWPVAKFSNRVSRAKTSLKAVLLVSSERMAPSVTEKYLALKAP